MSNTTIAGALQEYKDLMLELRELRSLQAASLKNKGVSVPDDAGFGDFPGLTDSIESAASMQGYAEIDMPVELQTGTLYSFMSSTGDAFFSSNTANIGIWKLNRDTQTVEQVFDSYQNWSLWYESRSGDIFVASSASVNGIYHWNGITFDCVYLSFYGWGKFFESSLGEVFAGSGSNGKGVLWWNGTEFVQVHTITTSGNWSIFISNSKGEVFVSGFSNGSPGIYKWTGSVFIQVYNTGYNWAYKFESKDEKLFVSSSNASSAGILLWNGDIFVQVRDIGYSWMYWFESKNGKVFVNSSNSSFPGIFCWEIDAFIQVYSVGTAWAYWFESKDGKIFVSGNSVGVFLWTIDTFVQVYSTGNLWELSEISSGDIFATSPASNTGILRWNGTEFTRIYSLGSSWQYRFESSLGDVLVAGAGSSNVGILRWDGTTFVKIHTLGYGWKYWSESDGVVRVANDTLGGLLRYENGGFTIERAYTGKPFGSKFTMFSDANTLGIIFSSVAFAMLKNIYSTAAIESGEHAFAVSTNRRSLLYTEVA